MINIEIKATQGKLEEKVNNSPKINFQKIKKKYFQKVT